MNTFSDSDKLILSEAIEQAKTTLSQNGRVVRITPADINSACSDYIRQRFNDISSKDVDIRPFVEGYSLWSNDAYLNQFPKSYKLILTEFRNDLYDTALLDNKTRNDIQKLIALIDEKIEAGSDNPEDVIEVGFSALSIYVSLDRTDPMKSLLSEICVFSSYLRLRAVSENNEIPGPRM